MIEEVLKLLASDIDFKTKLHLIEDAIVCYCVKEEQVFNCYRTLKHLELELPESSDEGECMDASRNVLKIIETELDILNVRMRIAQNLEDIGESGKPLQTAPPLPNQIDPFCLAKLTPVCLRKLTTLKRVN